jgi:hypothetical protein
LFLAFCLVAGCLHAEGNAPEGAGNTSIEIAQHLGVYGGDSFLVFGKARNSGQSAAGKVVLVVDFLDSERAKVASRAISSSGGIPVNGTWDFEVSLNGSAAQKVRFYEITVLYR